jgi:energy-converting hydrogenase Eha subunit E
MSITASSSASRRDSVVGSHASSLARTWVSYLYLAVASALSLLQPFEVPVVVSALLLRPAHIGVAPRFERRHERRAENTFGTTVTRLVESARALCPSLCLS